MRLETKFTKTQQVIEKEENFHNFLLYTCKPCTEITKKIALYVTSNKDYILIRDFLVGAARTRAPAATNYDVHAPRRKMLGSPAP